MTVSSEITKQVRFDSMDRVYRVSINDKSYVATRNLKTIKRIRRHSPYAHAELAVTVAEQKEVLRLIDLREKYCEQLKEANRP